MPVEPLSQTSDVMIEKRPTRRYYSLRWGLRWALGIHGLWLIFTLIDLAFFTRQPRVVLGSPVEVILDKNLPFDPTPHGRHQVDTPLPPKITDKPQPTPPQPAPPTPPAPQQKAQPKDVYQTRAAKKGPRPLPKQKKSPKLAGALKNLQDTTQKANHKNNVRQGAHNGVDDEDDVLQAAVKQQFMPCWNVDTILNAPNVEELIVTVRIQMKKDGTVQSADIESPKNPTDVFHRIAVTEAKNAVLDPRCQPLKLPGNKYNKWKTIVIAFDPRDVAPQ